MNTQSKFYCYFCAKKCKVEHGGHIFCPNGHYIIKGKFQEIIQPRSSGDFNGENKYRLNNPHGPICNELGDRI